MSRRISTYSRVRASGFANGMPYQPSTTWGPDTPRPRMKRPPERWSMVAAAMAVATGVRAAICTMPVPMRTFLVWAASQVANVKASLPHDSAVQRESKPTSSAACACSIMFGFGPLPQYPNVIPSLSASPDMVGTLGHLDVEADRSLHHEEADPLVGEAVGQP